MSFRLGSRLTAAAVVAAVGAPSAFAFRGGAEVEGAAGVPPAARGLAQRVGDTLTTAAGRLSRGGAALASPVARAGAARLASASADGGAPAAAPEHGMMDDASKHHVQHSLQRHMSGAVGTMPSMTIDAHSGDTRAGPARGFSAAAKVDDPQPVTTESRSDEEWAESGIERLKALKARVDDHDIFDRLSEDEWKALMKAFSDAAHAGRLGESFSEIKWLERSLDHHDSGTAWYGDGTTEEDFKIWSSLALRHFHLLANHPAKDLHMEPPHDDPVSEKERAVWIAVAADIDGKSDAVAKVLAKFDHDPGVQAAATASQAPAKAPSSPMSSSGGAKRAFSSERGEPRAGMLHTFKVRVGEAWKAVAANFEETSDTAANASATVKQVSDVQDAAKTPNASAKAPSPSTSSSGSAKRSLPSSPVASLTGMDRVDNFFSMLQQNTVAKSLWLTWIKFKVDEMPLDLQLSDSTYAIDGALATAVQGSEDVSKYVMNRVHDLMIRATSEKRAHPDFVWFDQRNAIRDDVLQMTLLSQEDAARLGRWVQARMLLEDFGKILDCPSSDLVVLKEALALATERNADQGQVLIELELLHLDAKTDRTSARLMPKEAWSDRIDRTVKRLRHLAETAAPTEEF